MKNLKYIFILLIFIIGSILLGNKVFAQEIKKQKPTFEKAEKKVFEVQCIAICKNGYQCSRNNNDTSMYCKQHYKISLRYKRNKL